jgi:hypothetical protein
MVVKVLNKSALHSNSDKSSELGYWLSRTSDERLWTVDFLREQYYGKCKQGLQRVFRVVHRKWG